MPTSTPTSTAPRRARDIARAELTRDIVATAKQHLATDGAAALSLRAVARDLGMASSAVYRYFPSRDALLTHLIVDAYDDLGDAVERAEARVRRTDLIERFIAVGRAVRRWAREHPHEYALIYGSPVPGYAAPQDTIAPATRVARVLTTILIDAHHGGRLEDLGAPSPTVQRDMDALRRTLQQSQQGDIPAGSLARGLSAWIAMFGYVNFELFGHLHNVVEHHESFLDQHLRTLAETIGLTG
jgi:AcrR family transcriptional regulator